MKREHTQTTHSCRRPPWTKLPLCPAILTTILLLPLSGCAQPPAPEEKGANQSLVEIGERSLEMAESMESDGQTSEANVSYKRALWAFKYHQHLTGEEPLLLEEALEGLQRTSRQFSNKE